MVFLVGGIPRPHDTPGHSCSISADLVPLCGLCAYHLLCPWKPCSPCSRVGPIGLPVHLKLCTIQFCEFSKRRTHSTRCSKHWSTSAKSDTSEVDDPPFGRFHNTLLRLGLVDLGTWHMVVAADRPLVILSAQLPR